MASSLNGVKFRGIQQASDGSIVYLLTSGTYMMVSEDGAATFSNRSLPFYAHDMLPHPTDPTMVLYTGWSPCCLKSLACTTCKAWLLGSDNKGQSWTNITDYQYYRGSLSYSWAPVSNSSMIASIAYTAYADKTGDQRIKLGEAMNLHLQSDFRDPTSMYAIIANGGPFYQTNNTYMMARVSTGRPGLSKLMVSRNYGKSFSTVSFPPISNFDAQREWLATESGNPFLASFDGPEYSVGNVFVSTGGLNSFTLSLQRLIARFAQAHWTHIGAAIPGTYIANANPTSDGLTTATVISYDHGGFWHPLKLSGATSSNAASRVHLSAPFPGSKFHAPSSTPGLIIAAGQIGSLLTSWTGERVLVSRDAGRSWNASLTGSYVVYGANGGSVLLASSDAGTFSTSLNYSLDFGATWSECNFAPMPVQVVSMRPNYDDHFSPIVIIDAKTSDGSYAILTLNITGIYSYTCTSSDFNNWPLTDDAGAMCVFGMERVYARRAAKSLCQKVNNQARLVASASCNCGQEDFVCPYCYLRNSNGVCDFMWQECSDDASVIPDAPSNCSGTFDLESSSISNILSPDSFCSGGWETGNLDAEISCPPTAVVDILPPPYSTLQGSIGVTAAAIALALCGIVIVAAYYGGRNFFMSDNKAELIEAWKHRPRQPSDKDKRRDTVKRAMEYSPSSDDNMPSSSLTVDLEASRERYSPSPLLMPMGQSTNSDSE